MECKFRLINLITFSAADIKICACCIPVIFQHHSAHIFRILRQIRIQYLCITDNNLCSGFLSEDNSWNTCHFLSQIIEIYAFLQFFTFTGSTSVCNKNRSTIFSQKLRSFIIQCRPFPSEASRKCSAFLYGFRLHLYRIFPAAAIIIRKRIVFVNICFSSVKAFACKKAGIGIWTLGVILPIMSICYPHISGSILIGNNQLCQKSFFITKIIIISYNKGLGITPPSG